MEFLPVFLRLKSKSCLVVGGGIIAARKVAFLSRSEASIKVVTPHVSDDLKLLLTEAIELIQRPFEDDDIQGHCLVIAATNSAEVNAHIGRLCDAAKTPVNVVDNARACSFVVPSVLSRDPVQLAISSGASSPVLARVLRTRLEALIPANYGDLAALLHEYRDTVRNTIPDGKQRKRFWENVVEGPIAELIFAGRKDKARKFLEQAMLESKNGQSEQGEVYLVGAGPGDPDLLTIRALRLMQQADVVVYDRLVSPPIMDMVKNDAQRIYVGKKSSDHSLPQGGINALLVKLAREGKRVIRLKGGDPFIFGRGGEEIETLIEERIDFQVVPGITAASGCATYSGIPLTHRDYSQACIFVTGHLKDNSVDLNWKMLANEQQTVVFYMGLQGVGGICRELIAHGRQANTPAALVQQGTTPSHRVLIGDLQTLPDLVVKHKVSAPTLIIVGEIVSLHEKLKWFKPGQELISETSALVEDHFEHQRTDS